MNRRIELVYDPDCPNVGRARDVLALALSELGLPPHWIEWNRMDPAAPEYIACRASPTILVDGRDVFGPAIGAAASCRLYTDGAGRLVGIPPREAILEALRRSSGPRVGNPPVRSMARGTTGDSPGTTGDNP